jgi:hypothetical protein
MDPGIGSSRRVHPDIVAREPREDRFEHLLNRATLSLSLPADEARAVELERREKRPRHRGGI